MGPTHPHQPITEPTDVEDWAFAADQWIAWARTENHDAYWAYERAFAEFVGEGLGFVEEFVVHGGVDEDAASGETDLAGVEEDGLMRQIRGEVDVGVLEDDDGRLAS